MQKIDVDEISEKSFELSSKIIKALYRSNLYSSNINLDIKFEFFMDAFLSLLIKDNEFDIKLKEKTLEHVVDRYCIILENAHNAYSLKGLKAYKDFLNDYESDYERIKKYIKVDTLHQDIINNVNMLLHKASKIKEKYLKQNENEVVKKLKIK